MSGGGTFYALPLNHADYTVTGAVREKKWEGHGPPVPPVSDAYGQLNDLCISQPHFDLHSHPLRLVLSSIWIRLNLSS